MNLHFYQCEVCGKVITILTDTGVPTFCCGQPMKELEPNRTDGAAEKHVPVFQADENSVKVQVGSTAHPMKEDHLITWIGVKTQRGFSFRALDPGSSPEARFFIETDDPAEAVYAFCNLHGLWCAENEKCAEAAEDCGEK